MLKALTLFVLSLLLWNCQSDTKKDTRKKNDYYLYLAHTRLAANDSIIPEVYQFNFDAFQATMLGGDLATLTFKDGMEQHLDSVFDFKKPNMLWSVGNHDDASKEEYFQLTGKKKYHLYQDKEVSIITLDSQDSLSSIIGDQRRFLLNTLDTLTTKNIIILSHKLIFMDQHPEMDKLINKVCNANKGDCYHCHNKNNFQEEIYPKLQQLENKNIFWVGGDLGFKETRFQYKDNNNIWFLGNGMDYKRDSNEVLLFKKTKDTLSHHFVSVDSLLNVQKNQKPLEELLK